MMGVGAQFRSVPPYFDHCRLLTDGWWAELSWARRGWDRSQPSPANTSRHDSRLRRLIRGLKHRSAKA